MSFITVGYTDKANRRNPMKPPGGGMSDIFSSNYEEPATNGKKSNKIVQSSVIATDETKTQENGHTETKICEQIKTLTVEENSNEVKTTETSNKVIEINTKTTDIKVNEEATNGNTKVESNICTNEKLTQSTKKAVNNIFPSEETDSGSALKRNRVPPGGYSSGLW
ncbi:hypothetical protein WA026_018535 [Henosepilachna vigintioctopunctata]|uniref:Microtubule-associated protein Jupiter n=1 Tax=Henosepilachna vigintioctopunctata TaxID=420089 RepID=A0AAW1U0Z4_9CUCU